MGELLAQRSTRPATWPNHRPGKFLDVLARRAGAEEVKRL